jgi:aspartate/methionine/tyrosine aminotransferase
MYAFFSIEGENDSSVTCRSLLETTRVGLAPGYMFGKASQAFLRMCICRNPEQLKIALERIGETFQR